jgi:hypothetical protein
MLEVRRNKGRDRTRMECSWKGRDRGEWNVRGKGKEKICTLMAVICKIITIFAGYMNDGQ